MLEEIAIRLIDQTNIMQEQLDFELHKIVFDAANVEHICRGINTNMNSIALVYAMPKQNTLLTNQMDFRQITKAIEECVKAYPETASLFRRHSIDVYDD